MIKRARPNRKRNDAARPRPGRTTRWLRILAFVAVLAALGGGIWYGRHSTDVRPAGLVTWADRFFTIHTVEISEGQRVSREEVLALLDLAPGAGLVSADPAMLQHALETHPWIRRAEVRRVFPDTLMIDVSEREPMAVLRTGGRDFLLDQDATLIAQGLQGTYEGFPVLTGVEYTDAVLRSDGTADRLRSGIALAGLLDHAGARQMEVDLRVPGDTVAYASGFRVRFGDGSFEDKVDRYRRMSDKVFEPWGGREVEVDLRFQDRIIVKDKGGKRVWREKTRSS